MDLVSVSLVEFLKTGEFGPLSSGMTQDHVRELLGPPDDWADDPDNENDVGETSYSVYGHALEISFRRAAPYFIDWFQVDHLKYETTRLEDFGGRFSLEMDGLTWRSPPSAFLRQIDDQAAEVQFEIATGHLEFRVFFGDSVEMFFVSSNPVSLSPGATDSRHSLAAVLRDIEGHSLVECVYSFSQPRGREERIRMRTVYGPATKWMSGSEYLALISE